MTHPIVVTGAAGRIGGVGGLVAEALRATGAEVVGDLTRPADVGCALAGCRRMDFGTISTLRNSLCEG